MRSAQDPAECDRDGGCRHQQPARSWRRRNCSVNDACELALRLEEARAKVCCLIIFFLFVVDMLI